FAANYQTNSMKLITTLCFGLLAGGSLWAQSSKSTLGFLVDNRIKSIAPPDFKKINPPIYLQNQLANKTTAGNQRILAVANKAFDGTNFIRNGDSTRIYWRKNFGTDFNYYDQFIESYFNPFLRIMEPEIMNYDSTMGYITLAPGGPYSGSS